MVYNCNLGWWSTVPQGGSMGTNCNCGLFYTTVPPEFPCGNPPCGLPSCGFCNGSFSKIGCSPCNPRHFVRKSLLTITGAFFTQGDTIQPQPSTANVAVRYYNASQQWATTIIGMTSSVNAQGVTIWTAVWDTSAVVPYQCPDPLPPNQTQGPFCECWCDPFGRDTRRVDWVVYSAGNNVQAAAEGFIFVEANKANTI